MKKLLKYLTSTVAIAIAAAFTSSAWATTYADSTGETISASIIDIASVEVLNNDTDLIFKITVVGDPVATDWGKYMVGIDLDGGGATGDTNGNGWGRPISMSMGMDYWVGTWVDSGNGAEVYEYDNATNLWILTNATYATAGGLGINKSTNSVTVNYPFASLGLAIGNSFYFDVYTSGGGGGDGAIDALANPAQSIANWGDSYDSGALVEMYTLVPPPTNSVTLLVNMEAAEADNPSFLIGDDVYVRGAFNGWLDPDPTVNTNAPNWLLTQDTGNTYGLGTNVYFGVFDITGFNGTEYAFKFWSFFTDTYESSGYEYPMLSCGGNRTLTIVNEGGSMTNALIDFSDRSNADPTNTVKFSVDMSVQEAFSLFDTNADSVLCRGNFNNWDTSFVLTNDPGSTNVSVYSGELDFVAPCTACFNYKFFYGEPPDYTNGVYESGSNRQLDINCTNPVLPVVFFDNVSGVCDFVTDVTNYVTFTVDMSQAIEVVSNAVYDGSWDVYLSGDFLGWPDWTTTGLTNSQLTQVGGTSNFSITLPFAPGDKLKMNYKYGAYVPSQDNSSALDNEAGFGQNHVRWIRTTPGQTNYSVSDVWTGTNAQNIVNLVEDQLSVAAKGGAPGTVTLEWEGLRCAEMHSATNINGPFNYLFDAPGVVATNIPATDGERYYRMVQP